MTESLSRIPITVISGFLGSGKTTLLNRILSSRVKNKLAVIVNDFGDINLDSQFVEVVQENMIALSGGCVCCSIRTDLFDTVLRLVESDSPPEHILIECSGVSDPGMVASTLLAPMLRKYVRVDGIITVIDAQEIMRSYYKTPVLIVKQIKLSNFIILNKTDMVSLQEKEDIKNWIRGWSPRIRIMEAVNARVPIELLFGFEDFNADRFYSQQNREIREINQNQHKCDCGNCKNGEPCNCQQQKKSMSMLRPVTTPSINMDGDDHSQDFESFSYQTDKLFAREALTKWVECLPSDIIRAKGMVVLGKVEGVYQFNLVGNWYRFEEKKGISEFSVSQLVFIGHRGWTKNYDMKKNLDNCLMQNQEVL